MSDHNIIQIETNIKIVEEKQNHQIKKRNLSNGDLNFSNASADADLFNNSWSMLLTDVKLIKCIRLLLTFSWKFANNMFCQRKVQENTKYPETEGL